MQDALHQMIIMFTPWKQLKETQKNYPSVSICTDSLLLLHYGLAEGNFRKRVYLRDAWRDKQRMFTVDN